jgi:non-ribosomal peptide synthetase component F
LHCNTNITPGVILQTAWGILLQRFNDTDDVVFGTVVSGRPSDIRDVESIPGPFINTIPFRIRCDRTDLLRDVLGSAKSASVDSMPYQHYSLAELQAQLKRKEPLFDHMVLVNNYPLDRTLAKTSEKKVNTALRWKMCIPSNKHIIR